MIQESPQVSTKTSAGLSINPRRCGEGVYTCAWTHVPATQLRVYQQLSEIFLALSQFAHFLLTLVVSAFLDVLFVDLFAFLWRQQQIAAVKHDLVQFLLPRGEHGHLHSHTPLSDTTVTASKYISLWLKQQELIRRWDSERELFYDDIVHVQASAYAHWTDFQISTINIYARPNLCT